MPFPPRQRWQTVAIVQPRKQKEFREVGRLSTTRTVKHLRSVGTIRNPKTLQRLFLPSIAGHQQVFLVSEGTSTLSANFPSSENGFILLFLKQGIGGIT